MDVEVKDGTHGGRIIVLSVGGFERFFGHVKATRLRDTSELEIGQVEVARLTPRAGGRWPRGTGISSDPVAIQFAADLQESDRLRLRFQLGSNFAGTWLDDRFPCNAKEKVRVLVRGARSFSSDAAP